MKKLGVWIAGIIGPIIVGYVVWLMTRTPPPPPPPAVTTFEGMVYSGSAPVAKAMVAVDLTGAAGENGPVHDFTDENGAYRIEFTGLPSDAGATLSVTANGYKAAGSKSLTSPLKTDTHLDFPLDPVMVVAPQPGPGLHPLHPVEQGVVHMPVYVPKIASKAVRIQVQH